MGRGVWRLAESGNACQAVALVHFTLPSFMPCQTLNAVLQCQVQQNPGLPPHPLYSLGVYESPQPLMPACAPALRPCRYGDGTLRLTVEENVIFPNVKEEHLEEMQAELVFNKYKINAGERTAGGCTRLRSTRNTGERERAWGVGGGGGGRKRESFFSVFFLFFVCETRREEKGFGGGREELWG